MEGKPVCLGVILPILAFFVGPGKDTEFSPDSVRYRDIFHVTLVVLNDVETLYVCCGNLFCIIVRGSMLVLNMELQYF